MKLRELVAELRCRRVFRVVVAYLSGGSVLVAATTVFPALELPAWAADLVITVTILGFPVAIAVARSFDRTRGVPVPTAAMVEAPATARRGKSSRVLRLLPVALVVMTVLAAGGQYVVQHQRTEVRTDELDASLVAVLPFDVTRAERELAYLREGLVDLLAVKLTGARRAVDVRTTLAAWRDHADGAEDAPLELALQVASRLRARTVLRGSVDGSANRVTVSVSLIDVASGRVLASAAKSGGADELPALLDVLVATVPGLDGGDADENLAALTSTSAAALREYLDGNAHSRRGRYRQAVESYARALQLDSTFALAALNVIDAAGTEPGVPGDWAARGRQVLLAHRARLAPRERAYVEARWPLEPATSVAASLERLERLTQQYPDWPEAWYHYGDALYHSGALVGAGEHVERARAAFDHALALDSTYAVALQHLLLLADRQGDTAFLSRFVERYLDAEPASSFAYELRLRDAHWRGDTAALHRMYAALDTLDTRSLSGVAIDHQLTPRPLHRLEFARRAAELLRLRASVTAERDNALLYRYQIEMNAGRPHAALAAMDSVTPTDPLAWDRRRMYDAVYWDGDSTSAAAAAERVERHLRNVARGPLTDLDASALCAATTLQLARWETDGAQSAIERLRVPHPASTAPHARELCATTLAALLSDIERAPDAEARLLALDSLLRTGPLANGFREHGNITAARLFEARGDLDRALAAARRRLLSHGGQSYLSTFLELECRLASSGGHDDGARRACTRYLALRSDPEPPLAERLAPPREELARLMADSR